MAETTSLDQPRARPHWTPIGYMSYLRAIRRVSPLFKAGTALEQLASDSWQIAPASTTIIRPGISLPGQLERVTGMAYTKDPARDMRGGVVKTYAATRGFLLKNTWLLGGSLFKSRWRLDLHSRARLSRAERFAPKLKVETEIERAAIYSSYDGNEFFGLWLTDDCTFYPLAAAEGLPVTSRRPVSPHILEYESLLGMDPIRTDAAFLREVVCFDDDWGYGASKHARFAALRATLLAKFRSEPHPGAFILRRASGNSRIMKNESEIAESLRDTRGFRIVDVTKNSASEILAACAGARVLAGTEGSHLSHGLMVLEPGASLLTLQPPYRFCSVLKLVTDMEGQHFGFVLGKPDEGGFIVDLDEVQRTLDLLPPT